MRLSDIHENHLLGGGLVALGLSLGGASAVAGLMAADHMAGAAALCGPVADHCVQCVAAVAMLVAALGASAAGAWLLRSRPALQRAG